MLKCNFYIYLLKIQIKCSYQTQKITHGTQTMEKYNFTSGYLSFKSNVGTKYNKIQIVSKLVKGESLSK